MIFFQSLCTEAAVLLCFLSSWSFSHMADSSIAKFLLDPATWHSFYLLDGWVSPVVVLFINSFFSFVVSTFTTFDSSFSFSCFLSCFFFSFFFFFFLFGTFYKLVLKIEKILQSLKNCFFSFISFCSQFHNFLLFFAVVCETKHNAYVGL